MKSRTILCIAFVLSGMMFVFSNPALCAGESSAIAVMSGNQEAKPNLQIVQFCEQHLNRKVGDGDCFDLAKHALHEAGLKRRLPEHPNKGDFVWGELVLCLQGNGSEATAQGRMGDITPGDIIQFRDAVFKRKKKSERFGHHTAVVVQVSNNGSDVKVLHQNYRGKRVVTELNLHLLDLKSGWIRVYQPTRADWCQP
jgi:myosin tail region-interacting protein MTI1